MKPSGAIAAAATIMLARLGSPVGFLKLLAIAVAKDNPCRAPRWCGWSDRAAMRLIGR
jgi:hypothetical protein